jgi:hypothetical protein
MLYRTFLFVIISAVFIKGSKAQGIYGSTVKKNTFFFESLGNGFLYSFNYDRIYSVNEKYRMAARIGIAVTPWWYSIPSEVSWLRGRENNYLEVGMGFTPINTIYKGTNKKEFTFITAVRVGYRHQKHDGGFFFKTGILPFSFVDFNWKYYRYTKQISINDIHVGSDPMIIPWIGIAAGYTLKK